MSEPTKLPDIVHVVWLDSGILANIWEDRDEVTSRTAEMLKQPMRSAGFLLADTDDGVTVGLSLNPYRDDVAQVMFIPRACVLEMTKWQGLT